MLFKKKEKPPLSQAVRIVYDAVEVAYKYKRDISYMPTEADLTLFQQLESALLECHSTASYITRCMHQRIAGEPEGVKKFGDVETMNYHYP